MNSDTREHYYRRLKVASIISLFIVVIIYAVITFLPERNNFEDLEPIKEGLINLEDEFEKFYSLEDNITEEHHLWHMNPSETIMNHGHAQDDFFIIKDNVIKYFISLAMLGMMDEFYNQFDPNVVIKDFPDPKLMLEQQKALFQLFTRDGTLENIRILSYTPMYEENQQLALVELIYSDKERFRVNIALERLGDEHSRSVQWYIANSMHDIVQDITY